MDPQTVTLIVAGMGMIGTLLAGFGGAYLNHKWSVERQNNDRKIELKIKNIDNAYALLTNLKKLCGSKKVSEMREEGTKPEMIIDKIESIIANITVISELYIPSIRLHVGEISSIFVDIKKDYRKCVDSYRPEPNIITADVDLSPNLNSILLRKIREHVDNAQAELRKILEQQNL